MHRAARTMSPSGPLGARRAARRLWDTLVIACGSNVTWLTAKMCADKPRMADVRSIAYVCSMPLNYFVYVVFLCLTHFVSFTQRQLIICP
ncbi:hypothetical protein HYPSUDRAFT_448612 [Hypholoma sublateritium FD-334 SS-4]|uniref:Uncharacterized protein n=1 Tax=Hypholoma sublateritium (strain FD-334 SS-4) TaxID=945553 RepID=A0A0D2P0W0_HYPSF|nr:hypothetical protein HYPSUDRAFT_448612 [Hypholoma sublateritium FD-334 SS-4]